MLDQKWRVREALALELDRSRGGCGCDLERELVKVVLGDEESADLGGSGPVRLAQEVVLEKA